MWVLSFFSIPFYQPIALVIASGIVVCIPLRKEKPFLTLWKENLHAVFSALEILFYIGILTGIWGISGTTAEMLYQGKLWMNPKYFLNLCLLLTGIAALVCGSSWTTAGTLGPVFIALGNELGIPPELSCGAIISGCYFGDKLSPLSDTTNLASSIVGIDLFSHIFHMAKTTIPSFLFAHLVFWGISQNLSSYISFETKDSSEPHSLLPLVPIILLFGSALLGAKPRLSLWLGILSGSFFAFGKGETWISILETAVLGTQDGSGGIFSILSTEALVLTAILFGSTLGAFGYLTATLDLISQKLKQREDVLIVCMGSSLALNALTADQYLSLTIPGSTYKPLAEYWNLPKKDLSRCLEDFGTLSSPLIPWNSCGLFLASSLGVSTWEYLPFVFFIWIHMFLSAGLLFLKKRKSVLI